MSDLAVVGWYSGSKVLVLLTGILKEKDMKAIVYTQYGPPEVLQFTEVEKPTPKEDEVLIKVHAASVNAADWRMMRAHLFLVRFVSGLLRPTITVLGADVAGRVEAVGRNAKQYQPGDEVFGDLSASGWGGFAEYVAVPESAIAPKSIRLTFEEAAALPMATVSATAMRAVGIVVSFSRGF
jgi:NADPH:quinone reductase-like Zn-dependent oxidoreductase